MAQGSQSKSGASPAGFEATPGKTPGTPRTFGSGYLFGVPIGDLGWFASLLMGLATGMAAFFASTFCAILFLLLYNSTTHHALDYALTYRDIGLPIGLIVMVLALAYLGSLWIRRHFRRA